MIDEEKKPNMLIVAVVIILGLFVVLESVALVIDTINTTGYPTVVIGILEGIKWVFAAAPIAIAIGFGRNIAGFAINWIRAKRKGDPTTEYSLTWLGETVTKFEGWIVVITPFVNIIVLNLPAKYKQIGMLATGAAFALFDMALSEIKRIIAESRKNGG